MLCPYCGQQAEWVENKEIYGKNYGKSFMIWLCRKCDAYVGCHSNTKRPLGTIADRETRAYRCQAHELFDKLWKRKKHEGRMKRHEAYELLKRKFGREIHIGESDIETCKKIIQWCEKRKQNDKKRT